MLKLEQYYRENSKLKIAGIEYLYIQGSSVSLRAD